MDVSTPALGSPVRAVVFDVGEVLIDESREYGEWADWLGVPRHTFSAVFGAAIAQGRDRIEAFHRFDPGFELTEERQRRLDAGQGEYVSAEDLYPDARSCLSALTRAGYLVGLAGNQTARAGGFLRELDLAAAFIGTSGEWGVEKPSPEFFERVVQETGFAPAEVAYVSDRLYNDVLPARAAGLVTVLIRRGPWGFIHADEPDVEHADVKITSLDQLLPALVTFGRNSRPG
jgi:HAD superfamily hydrolase (TIGR01549 family)